MGKDKIIMYDSPEAGRLVMVEVWEVDNPNGIIYTKNEHLARWNNCTHLKCECGGIRSKHYTICEDCRNKKALERYKALPFEEWDGKKPVVTWDGDEYFFDIDFLEDYMYDNEFEEIDLLICSPIGYSYISSENVAPDCHEDFEIPAELERRINEFNAYVKTLSPHSWEPGKIRTSHKLDRDKNVQASVATDDDSSNDADNQKNLLDNNQKPNE